MRNFILTTDYFRFYIYRFDQLINMQLRARGPPGHVLAMTS